MNNLISGSDCTIRRGDYTFPECQVDDVHLNIAIYDDHTRVTGTYTITPLPQTGEISQGGEATGKITLWGDDTLRFISLTVNGKSVHPDEKSLAANAITLTLSGASTVVITSDINPDANTALEGLYRSGGMYCTQCEPEGFRRIIWYPDHPDILSVFTTRIEASKSLPFLLSNGNLTDQGDLPDDRHFAVWHDPHPKPSYLFAMVAGDLELVEDHFITNDGRRVALQIYVEHGNAHLCGHAMKSLKKSMKWDEDVFGLSYDLDVFMIVAVSHFNMGAMENKGLNIFNSKYVLANTKTATDDDLDRVESIIAHEYFHNWTGNRITCRDWFQLTLKEGLTVYRDQEFTADMHSRGVKRINDVALLKAIQFPEDASPTAHPIRPETYQEINNFYTPTVYEKGAEVIRMLEHILGKVGFMKGVALYIKTHDGQAATCEDFIVAMENANQANLSQFRHWYSQAGTPKVKVSRHYDSSKNTLTIQFHQSIPENPAIHTRQELVIPICMGLVSADGKPLPLIKEGQKKGTKECVITLTEKKETHRFENVPADAVPSLMRGFSAPVQLESDLNSDELLLLLAADKDSYGRWNAGQELMKSLILDIIKHENINDSINSNINKLSSSFIAILEEKNLDYAVKAELLKLPSQQVVEAALQLVDPLAVWSARRKLAKAIARHIWVPAQAIITRFMTDLGKCDAGQRRLLNVLIHLLVLTREEKPYQQALLMAGHKNMTISMAGLGALNQSDAAERMQAMAEFEERWKNDSLVMEKWFSLEASCPYVSTPKHCDELMRHPAFDPGNPNKLRSVISVFAALNYRMFYANDGSGYLFLAHHIAEIDARNPQIAARMVLPLTRFSRYHEDRQALMKGALIRLKTAKTLSSDLSEVIEKTLSPKR